jgi:O-antigen ligase
MGCELDNKINFGNISLLLGMMSLAGLFLIKETRFKKSFAIISILAFILGVTGSVLSGARGGWLAIPF